MGKAGTPTQIFVNECSLQGQFQTQAHFEQALKVFMSVFENIKHNKNLHKELYKNELFIEYQAIKGSPFQANLNQIKDKSLKTAFTSLVFNKLNPINWRYQQVHALHDNYVLVETLENITDTSIAEISERKLQQNEVAYLLINFPDSSFNASHPDFSLCQLIAVLKNQGATSIFVDCLDNKLAFEQWVQNKLDNRNFLETNPDRFDKTSKCVQGQPVYTERDTNYTWYLDNLHKDHFEVFNRQGKHLGEANSEGILDTTKIDSSKRYS